MESKLDQQIIDILDQIERSNENIFITGEAGTGKSTLLELFRKKTKKRVVTLAPTGMAALNVNGETIHKFFKFPTDINMKMIASPHFSSRDIDRYKKLDTIIIDEVSMVRADLLDCIHVFLSLYGPEIGKPFGGVQMIFIGDLYQLPPVVAYSALESFNTSYDSAYFFSAQQVDLTNLRIFQLTKVYRQTDKSFVRLLNKIRTNTVNTNDLAMLNQRKIGSNELMDVQGSAINLTSTKAVANEINQHYLAELPTELFIREAEFTGEFNKDLYPTETSLQFKAGAQIMFVNNDSEGRWVNGSLGIISSIEKSDTDEEHLLIKLLDTEKMLEVKPHIWGIMEKCQQMRQNMQLRGQLLVRLSNIP